jgi:protein-L-isoaspartate(D-aspartate) O-methyltransferase
MSDFLIMRQNMVKGQILPENVTHPLLINAFLTLPRENFVPRQFAHIAYMDTNFPLTKGRCLLNPSTLARLLEALDPLPSDKILYVGGGTGYGPALLNQMVSHLIALDSEETLTQEAKRLIDEMRLLNIEVILGPLIEGWEQESPYDKILIEGCVDFIPLNLAAQLKEGGQLVTLKYEKSKGRHAIKIDKKQGVFTETFLFDAFAPRLKPFRTEKTFVFSEKK